MLVFYLILLVILFIGLEGKRGGCFDDFLDRKQTDAVKGLFIWMVFLSHSLGELRTAGFMPDGFLDAAGFWFRAQLGQLVIVPFLFYSGYGVMQAIKNKGRGYLDRFPRHRLLGTLLNFDVAVLLFIVLNLLMEVRMGLAQIGWSFIGWSNVGNSNWYIFVILFCYLVSWISGRIFSEGGWRTVAMTTFLVLLGEAALSFLKHGHPWWYNTMLCYPAGMCLSFCQDKVVPFVRRYFWPVFWGLLAVFLFLHLQKWIPALRGLTYNVKGIAFAGIVVLMTMKVKSGNRFLYWAGGCVFPIYIFQRLPMRAFKYWVGDSWICGNPYLFVLLCALLTACIALTYKYWKIKLQ
jgi:membrane-bound acyltransferase YfiQ involved in biofilm formation